VIDEFGPPTSSSQRKTVAKGWAWGVCWLMFACTALNYMDRQAITLVGEQIRSDYGISQVGFGWVLAAFQLTYALFQVPVGFLTDRWNVRWVYAGAVAWWSLAAIAVSFSPTLGALMAFRAMLGVGEAFNWPAALRVTATILPPEDRSLGNGIFNSGAAVGAVVTPLVVTPLVPLLGWRMAFALIGILGFVWVGVWLVATGREHHHAFEKIAEPAALPESRPPSSKRFLIALGVLELATLSVGSLYFELGLPAIWWAIATQMIGILVVARLLPMSELARHRWATSLGEVVRLQRFWIMAVVAISINVCWHFLVGWLPTYLKTDRGMTFVTGGLLSAVPFLAADAGNLLGGWITGKLARAGLSPSRARIRVIFFCTILISCGAWVGFIRNDTLTIILLAVMALGTAAFMVNYFAFCQDVVPKYTGLVVGILGGLGNLFAAGFSPIAGMVKDQTGNFTPVFLLVGFLPIIGLLALLLGWRERDPELN
jgi:ACS family hexuronate transporter-like MFS transporter